MELAFSVLYDPDETLNFVAPNKYEVRKAKEFELNFSVSFMDDYRVKYDLREKLCLDWHGEEKLPTAFGFLC